MFFHSIITMSNRRLSNINDYDGHYPDAPDTRWVRDNRAAPTVYCEGNYRPTWERSLATRSLQQTIRLP